MIITTERLRAEPLRAEHATVMFPILLDERIYTFLPEKPPASVAALRERYQFLSSGRSPEGKEQWLNWILYEQKSEKPVGFFQATVRVNSCSVAYVLNPDYWGLGYAAEAAVAIISQLFESFTIPSVTAEINPQHEASKRLVKRLGFSFVRHDVDENDDIYEITRTEWFHH